MITMPFFNWIKLFHQFNNRNKIYHLLSAIYITLFLLIRMIFGSYVTYSLIVDILQLQNIEFPFFGKVIVVTWIKIFGIVIPSVIQFLNLINLIGIIHSSIKNYLIRRKENKVIDNENYIINRDSIDSLQNYDELPLIGSNKIKKSKSFDNDEYLFTELQLF